MAVVLQLDAPEPHARALRAWPSRHQASTGPRGTLAARPGHGGLRPRAFSPPPHCLRQPRTCAVGQHVLELALG